MKLGADTSRWVRGWQEGHATVSSHRHFQKHDALEHGQRYVHQCHESWISEALGRVSKNAYSAWPQRVRQYLQSKMLHSWFQNPSQKHKPAVHRGCAHLGLPSSSPHWLKKKKFMTCKPAHFLHKDRLSLQRSVDISKLVHLWCQWWLLSWTKQGRKAAETPTRRTLQWRGCWCAMAVATVKRLNWSCKGKCSPGQGRRHGNRRSLSVWGGGGGDGCLNWSVFLIKSC